MRSILGNCPEKGKRPMVLYHAISSYQLLEVMLHRMAFHQREKAVLILPDFIVGKYPQYRKLASRHFFDEVYLFPYLHIPHRDEECILQDVIRFYREKIPYDISSFSEVYIAGAHFYFSLYLLYCRIPFAFFEDAAGLSRPEELHRALSKKFPVHAAIARKYGLYDGSHPLVRRIICLKRAQTRDVSGEKYVDFSVEKALQALSLPERKKVIRFFLRHRLQARGNAILLTQHFANLGSMSQGEQRRLYERLRDGALRGIHLIVKRHPDDTLDYREIFPDAYVIRQIFPAELLPYVFREKPEALYTFDSTGCENLSSHFCIQKIEREKDGE